MHSHKTSISVPPAGLSNPSRGGRIRIPLTLMKYVDHIQSSPLASRLVHGTFWSMVGIMLSRSLGLAASVITARILGKQDFGALGIIQSTLAMFQVFAGFGLGLTATKYVAEFRSKDPKRAGYIIALSGTVAAMTGGMVAACAYFGSDWLAVHSLAAPRLAPLLRVSSLALLFTAINGAQVGTLSGFEAFRKIAKINFISGLVTVPLSVAGVLLAGLYGAVVASLLSTIFGCILCYFATRSVLREAGIQVRFHHCLKELPILWKFSVPAVLSGMMVTPVNWFCNAMLVRQPNGYSEMAVYSASNAWRTALMFLPMFLMQASLPILSSASGESTRGDFRKTLNMSQSIMVGVSFPLATALMLIAGPVLRMYGKDFRSGQTVLVGVVLTALIQCIGAATGPAIEAKGRMWTAMGINWAWAGMYLAFVYTTVARYGAVSLAYSSAAAYVLLTIGAFLYLRHDLPAGMLRRVFLALAFALLLTAGCVLTPEKARLFLVIPATALSAFVGLAYLSDRGLVRAAITVGTGSSAVRPQPVEP